MQDPPAGDAALAGGQRGLLRVLTCGSVDDGKSTLIGRLLHDSQRIMDDTLAALERDSRRWGTAGEEMDLALLVDGLEAERQQGITIDVAYRYFATPRRSFILADTPGHEQYTRNMATGASTAEVAVLLVDARKGLLTQTRRHAQICALLGIRDLVLAVNKMDLVGFAEDAFRAIAAEHGSLAARLGLRGAFAVPLSARAGDNIARRSDRMPWHAGPTLLELLETIEPARDDAAAPFRFPVQWVSRPDAEFRGFAGTVASGAVAVGDPVVVAASGRATRIARIVTADGDLDRAAAGEAVTLVLQDQVDLARGDLLAPPAARPAVADQFAAHLLWLETEPLLPGRQYLLRIGTQWVSASVTAIRHRLEVNSGEKVAARQLEQNEIGVCHLSTGAAVPLDPYAANRATGAFILVDRFSNATVGAGMVDFPLRRAGNVHLERFAVDRQARAALDHQAPLVIWFTGLSGAGKSTIANLLEVELHRRGRHTYTLDGDNLRHGLNRDLGFTEADRVENIRRAGEVARLMADAGLIVICAFISPFRAERQAVRERLPAGEFVEVFVDTPIEECMRRDTKGLYAKAKAGQLRNLTGVDSAYEPPEAPEIRLQAGGGTPAALAAEVIAFLEATGRLARG
ncbi:sulfate adenylyltransferase subunit CysN [Paracraurococcus ruber]|uniref:Multifunctional fusion protein n=1 Tax=Paracraurococcus ruber TaxID=77675 RepID=A0ABS1CZ48_9PROT|nr:sulfate adenylyltransferase subunit CysN [Paracraurococcus ruber]MBK1659600.1 adenylyl-sulfate kinase [Paracraurococcus ruber]TDG28451.1 sulfate adenylyltransferase subunit CysN [Paracraurococcus ruber]